MLPPKTRRHAFECADMCAHMDIMKHANIKQHSLPLKYTVYAHLHPPATWHNYSRLVCQSKRAPFHSLQVPDVPVTASHQPAPSGTCGIEGEMREKEKWLGAEIQSHSLLLLKRQTNRQALEKQTERNAQKPVNMDFNNQLYFVQQRLFWAQIG